MSGLDLESWRVRAFELCWSSHGGSGLGMPWSDMLDLDVDEANWLLDAIRKRRTDESNAIRQAAKAGR